MAMVVRANRDEDGIGGHISTYASAATLYEVGFNHFFRGKHGRRSRGDHGLLPGPRRRRASTPARSSRAGSRDEQLENFRRELHARRRAVVLSAPVADAGLLGVPDGVDGPRARSWPSTRRASTATWRTAASSTPSDPKVWAFLGDGETDEPEALGAITLASREKLDNLIFVINCNLQRLDGPVRGNGKIIQELEAVFRGAGWNVIKVIWGSDWDPLLAKDTRRPAGHAAWARSSTASTRSTPSSRGAYIREHFFGADPRLLEMVEHLTDEQLQQAAPRRPRPGEGLRRLQGGRRAQGLADGHPGQDDQGLRPGRGRRGQEHHAPAEEAERGGAARVPHRGSTSRSPTRRSRKAPFYRPPDDSPEMQYLQRAARGAGRLRARAARAPRSPLKPPARTTLRGVLRGHRRARGLDHDGVRAHAGEAAARHGTSASSSCRSCPTRRARSAWRRCSASSASTRTSASSTSRSTRTRCSTTRRPRTGRSSRRASPRPARCRRSSPPAPPTRPTASTRSRSSSTTRCSASSASAT